tara:strand:- start:181 stop:1164 length:984 start_codon:yes stop_codon:yes gene_type:complete
MKNLKNILVTVVIFLFLFNGLSVAEEFNTTQPPHVPPHTSRIMPEIVVVNFTAKEFIGPLGAGKNYKFWSYNGTVPGPMIRVRLGDTVEFHLSNDDTNQYPHNIDLHAVNGPGGGAEATLVAPGEEKIFQFKTLHPGLFIYHCSSPIPGIPAHIANGMYGLILVEPKHGLSRADHEFYVFQSEFFTQPSEEGVLEFSLEKGILEQPDYIVFNGKSGALVGDKALEAKVGDKIRIYFGNIGPNSASSFHIIGEVFDQVYLEGALNGIANKNVQTTLVPSGGAAILEFKVDFPGNYFLVDHSIFRINKGAVAVLKVTGEEDPEIFRVLD